MKNKKPINENELNELLKDLYLEENSKTVNEKDAAFVIGQEYPVNIDSKKEEELLKKLYGKSSGLGGFKFYLSVIAVCGLITFLVIYFFPKTNTPVSNNSNQTQQNNQTNNDHNQNSSSAIENDNGIIKNPDGSIKVVDTFGRPKIATSIMVIDSNVTNNIKNPIEVSQKSERAVPYLTEKDKVRYAKVKNQILLKLVKSDKGLYTHIPANKINYAGKEIILDGFTIRNMGISNLEYKTFLADLIIQKRDADYFTSQVFSGNWAKQSYSSLANSYFVDEKYNDFPVVNITLEGANLFCKWLEEETAAFIKQNNININPPKIRLPYDEEWINAAREGYAKIAFEKGYNSIYDESEGLVNHSFTNRAELVKKRVKRIDTLYTQFTTNRYGWNEKEIIEFLGTGFKYYDPNPADTIYTNRMKVFGKLGRVSEMVCQKNNARVWLTGLSWKSKEDYLKLENEFKTNSSSPFVGFRPVIINPEDPEYKNPFW